MIRLSTVTYLDLYDEPIPRKEDLLKGVNSSAIVVKMATINAQLYLDNKDPVIQRKITTNITEKFPEKDRIHVNNQLKKQNGNFYLWGRQYLLEFMKYVLLESTEETYQEPTPEQEVLIFKSYLLQIEETTDKAYPEIDILNKQERDDLFYFRIVCSEYNLKNFISNNDTLNPILQIFQLLGFWNHRKTKDEFSKAWNAFLKKNGQDSFCTYLKGVLTLFNISKNYLTEKTFPWINTENLSPAYLDSLAFNLKKIKADSKNEEYLKLFKLSPLFKVGENKYAILDINSLVSKIYNGPLFEVYSNGNWNKKSFIEYKSNIGKELSEKVIFKGIFNRLFSQKVDKLKFDDADNDKYPDCYVRKRNVILLFEFKDYLFPDYLLNNYSFNQLKDYLDNKFIREVNAKDKNKGVNQIANQIEIIFGKGYEFDQPSNHFQQEDLEIYPFIIHTGFAYQMYGLNHYLNTAFKSKLNGRGAQVKDLVLIDLNTFFDFFCKKEFSLELLIKFLKAYYDKLIVNDIACRQEPSMLTYQNARMGFDEFYNKTFKSENENRTGEEIKDDMSSIIGINKNWFTNEE